MPAVDQPTRVVILGGGIGAISTAFWLTSTPELRQRYTVRVYNHGWRLGGKAASGRNHEHGERIQEHGLHMLMGWYEVAFKTIRACYAEWQKEPDNPFKTWEDAFTPLRQITLEQQIPNDPSGQWQTWNIPFPKTSGSPGEAGGGFIDDVVHKILSWLLEHLWNDLHLPDAIEPVGGELLGKAHAAAVHAAALSADERTSVYQDILRILTDFQKWFQEFAEPFLTLFHSEGYEICTFTDFALALMIGFIRDVLPDWERGLEQLNKIEFRDWLASAGASPKYIGFAPVRVLYDLAFAYKNGDSSTIDNGRIAAGAGLWTLLRMALTYKDAPLWRMSAGMGDTIFTPMYQVLRSRGVEINLFHRVTNLQLSGDAPAIESISMYQQVDLVNGSYEPFRKVQNLPCWPAEPKWDQIVGGEGIANQAWDLESMWCTYRPAGKPDVVLTRGKDFDVVVLAIPPASLRDIGAELIDPRRCPSIAAMHANMTWVPTLASQLWLKPNLIGLGWAHGPTVLSTYADPFRSWGEMSHLLAMEAWPAPAPLSCEYFCGTITPPPHIPPYGDRNFLKEQTDRVQQRFEQWLQANSATVWPNTAASGGKGFNPSLVVSDFYRVNLDPSEMYVQTFPDSVQFRLSPGNSGVTNLFLAGDWTKGTVDGGCAEGAFESGKMAAEAICKQPLDLPLP